VETVRAYAAHERNTLEDITRLRSQAQQLSQAGGSLPSQERADVEAALSGAVRNLIVSVEAYPDLKSNQNFLELQRQLAETEDRIAAGRRFYNANVRVYNTKVESVPSNIIASMFKFEKATYFEVEEPAVRQAPDVNFGEIAYRGDQDQRQLPPQQSAPPVQFDPRSDELPNPQEYQQPPQSRQPPQQNRYQAPQPGGDQAPQQGGYQAPQPGGYVPPETGSQNPNQQ
jgi:LemA protein